MISFYPYIGLETRFTGHTVPMERWSSFFQMDVPGGLHADGDGLLVAVGELRGHGGPCRGKYNNIPPYMRP